MKITIRDTALRAGIEVDLALDGDGPCLYSIDAEDGRSMFGIDVRPNGTIHVGTWDAEGQWVTAFRAGPLDDAQFNWVRLEDGDREDAD